MPSQISHHKAPAFDSSKPATPANTKGTRRGAFCVGSKFSPMQKRAPRAMRERAVLREHVTCKRLQQTQAQNSVRKSGHPSQKKALAYASAFFNEIRLTASEIWLRQVK